MRLFASAAFAVTFGLLSVAPALAADPPPTHAATTPEVSKMDLPTVQKGLSPLAGAFGVKVPDPATNEPTTATATAPPDTHKTMADVGDRALDMVQTVASKVADTMSKVAPKVWEIMIRQQYAKAISGLILPSICFIIGAIFCFVFGRMWKKPDGDWTANNNLTEVGVESLWRLALIRGFPSLWMTISAIYLGYAIQAAILLLINPEYYAIQDLLQSILNGGAPPA